MLDFAAKRNTTGVCKMKTIIAYYYTDDYGRFESELPAVTVSIEDTGNDKENDTLARKLGVEAGYPDMNTGFLQPQSLDNLEATYLNMRDDANAALRILDAAKSQEVNTVIDSGQAQIT